MEEDLVIAIVKCCWTRPTMVEGVVKERIRNAAPIEWLLTWAVFQLSLMGSEDPVNDIRDVALYTTVLQW